MIKQALEIELKKYESAYESYLMPYVPAIIRLDGRAFHSFTRKLDKPYDKRLINCFISLSEILCRELSAKISYTQSDEITLVLHQDDYKTQLPFGGRLQKLSSTTAAYATIHFNRLLKIYFPDYSRRDAIDWIDLERLLPTFDCRVFSVPSKIEACNVLLWREQDAVRNSIQSLGQYHFSHKQLQHKSCNKIQDMLMLEKNINWNNEPYFFKRGSWISKNQDGIYISKERPRFNQIINKEGFVFHGEEPKTAYN